MIEIKEVIQALAYLFMAIIGPPSSNDWVISETQNDSFALQTWLPGDYTSVKTNLGSKTLLNGDCSTAMLKCSYITNSQTNMSVSLSGVMTPDLRWATFEGLANLAPISIFFFNNKTWTDDQKIQPQFSLPLVIPGKNRPTVTFTCTAFQFGLPVSATLYAGLEKVKYYSFGANTVKDHPQILNLEVRTFIFHTIATVTVKQKNPIDYYTCNMGGIFVTHKIDWNQLGKTRNRAGAAALTRELIFGLLLIMLTAFV